MTDLPTRYHDQQTTSIVQARLADALRPGEHHPSAGRPGYVYVASSWRNPLQIGVIAALRSAGIDAYDFRHPKPGDEGFSWKDLGGPHASRPTIETYLGMVNHPIAEAGYERDLDAMKRADTFVLVLPCGRSAHLELGWAVGNSKRTAILLEEPVEPELMYRMADYLAPTLVDLLGFLGVED